MTERAQRVYDSASEVASKSEADRTTSEERGEVRGEGNGRRGMTERALRGLPLRESSCTHEPCEPTLGGKGLVKEGGTK